MGTYAVTTIMVYSTISRLELAFIESPEYLLYKKNSLSNNDSFFLSNETIVKNNEIDEMIMGFRLKVATSLTFWCGIIQVKKIKIIYLYLI